MQFSSLESQQPTAMANGENGADVPAASPNGVSEWPREGTGWGRRSVVDRWVWRTPWPWQRDSTIVSINVFYVLIMFIYLIMIILYLQSIFFCLLGLFWYDLEPLGHGGVPTQVFLRILLGEVQTSFRTGELPSSQRSSKSSNKSTKQETSQTFPKNIIQPTKDSSPKSLWIGTNNDDLTFDLLMSNKSKISWISQLF